MRTSVDFKTTVESTAPPGGRGSFELIVDKRTTTQDVTVVPARTDHALEFHGGRVAVLYFEVGEALG